jgi:hypothetical protein
MATPTVALRIGATAFEALGGPTGGIKHIAAWTMCRTALLIAVNSHLLQT